MTGRKRGGVTTSNPANLTPTASETRSEMETNHIHTDLSTWYSGAQGRRHLNRGPRMATKLERRQARRAAAVEAIRRFFGRRGS